MLDKGIWTPYGKDGANLAIKHPQDSRNQVQTNPQYQSLEIWTFRACHDVNRTHNVESIWIPHDTKAAATSSTQFPISREFARCHAYACCLLSLRLRASGQHVPISLSSTPPFLFEIRKLVELSCQWTFAAFPSSHSWTLSSRISDAAVATRTQSLPKVRQIHIPIAYGCQGHVEVLCQTRDKFFCKIPMWQSCWDSKEPGIKRERYMDALWQRRDEFGHKTPTGQSEPSSNESTIPKSRNMDFPCLS